MGSMIKMVTMFGFVCVLMVSCGRGAKATTAESYILAHRSEIESLIELFKTFGWQKFSRSSSGYMTVIDRNDEILAGYEKSEILPKNGKTFDGDSANFDAITAKLQKLSVKCIEGVGSLYIDFNDGMSLAVSQEHSRSDLIRIYGAREIAPGWYLYINTDD